MHAIMYWGVVNGGVQRRRQQRCRFTEPAGKVKFLHCLAVCSGLQVKEAHKQQVLWEKSLKNIVILNILA